MRQINDNQTASLIADDGDTLPADLVRRIVEAALLAAPQPLTVPQIAALFPDDAPAPIGSIQKALEILRGDCDGRGVELVEVASGYRYQVRTDVHPWVSRLWTERQTRYTRATLETLALIAYRQPITRGEIEQIRGVAVNANMVKALEEREWIRVVGHRDVPGRPELFGTTRIFLDYFGLKSLDALPALAELKDIPDLEPQFAFDVDPAVVANAALALDEESFDEGRARDDEAANDDLDPDDSIPEDSNPDDSIPDGVDAADPDTDTDEQAGINAAPELKND
ncbi:MAG: SMC-Scp complex subunit ScpB [Arenimonas sp.]